MAISFHNQGCDFSLEQSRKVAQWLKESVVSEGFKIGEINIIFCSDSELLKINKEFLEHDYLTDVITFDYSLEGVVGGDIYISVETVRSNAETFFCGFRSEILRVMVHGVMHLCGQKDKSVKERKMMQEKENYYLSKIVG